jgi:hypothetical protein
MTFGYRVDHWAASTSPNSTIDWSRTDVKGDMVGDRQGVTATAAAPPDKNPGKVCYEEPLGR